VTEASPSEINSLRDFEERTQTDGRVIDLISRWRFFGDVRLEAVEVRRPAFT